MDDFKNFVQDLGIDAFESNIKIAGVAIISNSGSLIFQTENWDIKSHIKTIIEVMRAPKSFVFNGINFLVTEVSDNGIITSSENDMGYIIFAPFQGGILLSYAMPQADPTKVLIFLKNYAMKLNRKI